MHRLSKRLCAILLTLCAVIGFLPMTSQAALVDSDDYIFQSLTLGGALQMNLLGEEATVNKYIDQGSVEITYPIGMDRKNTETKLYDEVNDTTQKTGKDGTPYRCATVDRVVAQMSDEIELVVKSSDLGVEVINQTYSIRDYLITLLNGIQTSQTKDLCLELLNYGAWAQKYFSYNIENLANEGYEVDQPKNAIPTTDIPKVTAEDNLEGINFYGTTVVFLSNAAVRFYFKAPNGVKNYTFEVNEKEYQPRAKSGLYFIEIPNINPQDMSNALSVTVTDKNSTNELSFSYTPTWFFIRSYDKAKSDTEKETYAELMKAAYSYYVEAKAYDKCVVTDADELDLTYISGDANSITVKTNLSYSPDMAVTSDLVTGISQTQDATDVDVSNVDSMAALTFTFGNEFAVGDTYSMPKGMAFVIDNQEYILKEDYVFQLAATGEDTYIWNTVEPVETVDVLMGFNDYSEITGADTGVKLSVGNMIGRMDINVDPRYVSEDVASLKVQPQGDYSNPGKHPYIKLDMSGTKYTGWEGTISQITSHADFSGYKSLSFDAFNPESTAQKVRMSLVILSGDSYITTVKQTYTLQPGLWNTCTYDLSVMAGFDFYDLKHVRFVVFEFLDHKESKADVPPVLYIDDLVGNVYQDGEGPVNTEYSYYSGVGFETRGQEYLFIGQGNIERDATIERVAYADITAIGKPENGGSYAVKLSHDSDYYPTFRIHFGEILPKDTVVTFSAYGKINGSSQHNQSIFEFSSGGDATEQFPCDVWTDLKITLQDAAEYVDLFWNIDRAGIISATASGEVYLDNFRVSEIELKGNLFDGLDFEEIGNKKFFGATGNVTDADPKVVTYGTGSIHKPDGGNYGNNVLMLVSGGDDVGYDNTEKVTSRINFGQTLKEGTEITFMVCGTYVDGSYMRGNTFTIRDNNNESLDSRELVKQSWTPITITLVNPAEYIDIQWDVKYLGRAPSDVTLYIDNFKAVAPAVDPAGNIYQGFTFEDGGNEKNVGYFVGQKATGNEYKDATVIRRATYTELGIPAPADGGTYALKMGHSSFAYPAFRLNFGRKIPQGTKIAFQAYIKADGIGTNNCVIEYTAGGDATMQFAANTWHTLTFTLSSDAEYVDLFWNINRAGAADNAPSEIYLDNVVVVSGGFTGGVGFEAEAVGNTGLFTGQGAANDAVLARVSYADLGVSAPANGGTYALKLSTVGNDRWPKFRVNFGEELPAGTLITFDAYSKLLAGNATWLYSIFEYTGVPNGNGEATGKLNYNEWTKLYFVLNETTDHLDLFWNIDRADFKDDTSSAEVYLDNFQAVRPATSASGDLNTGLDFEGEEDVESALLIAKPTEETEANKAVITRIPYSLAGITAPANGGEYALRLSNQSFGYPTFRLNFGTTLTAGTTITFDAYADYTSWHSVDQAVTMLAYSGAQGEAKHGDSAGGSFGYKQWKTISFTLTSDTDHVDLFWNVNDNPDITIQNNNAHLYLDNIRAEEHVDPSGNFLVGVGFEEKGNIGLFVGQDGSDHNAVMKRVSYSNVGVAAPANGGTYALQMTHASHRWPTFRINFGRTLKSGTVITFNAFVKYSTTPDINAAKSLFEGSGITAATDGFAYNTWAEQRIVLSDAADHVDLFWNMNQLSETSTATADTVLFLDNFLAVEPVEISGNIQEGLDFETSGNELWFTGTDDSNQAYRNVTIERVSYADTGVSALADGGNHALKLSHATNAWPIFRINFGEPLPAGTVITFDVYGYVAPGGVVNSDGAVKIDLFGNSKNTAKGTINQTYTDLVRWAKNAQWTEDCTIVLTAECSYLDLNGNIAELTNEGSAASYFLLDNIKVTVPLVFTGDFETGVGFENKGDIVPFTGVGGNESWRDASLEIVTIEDYLDDPLENGGSNALMLTCASSQWPTFRINFGKTLPSGTVVSFYAYTNDISGIRDTISIFEAIANCTETLEYNHGSWNKLSFTLTADCDHVDLMCNMDRRNTIDCADIEVYLDNFLAVKPVEISGDILEGLDFETSGNELHFGGVDGSESYRNVTIERVGYAEVTTSQALSTGGSYAMKLSHDSNRWPLFRINFGKTLLAGTTITFDVLGYVPDAYRTGNIVKIGVLNSSQAYAQGTINATYTDAVLYATYNTWTTGCTVKLIADCSYVDLQFDISECASADPASSYFLVDNVKAVVPEYEDADFEAGVTFEKAGHEDSFIGITDTQAATVERVAYADLGVNSDGRGDYALKLSHASDCWPHFRINFGKTLPAGTVITFDAYGNYDYVAAAGVNKYMKVQLVGSNATSSNSEQLIWTLVDTWKTCDPITLTADSDHLDLMYNVADSSHGNVPSWLLLDNIKATVPDMTFLNGVTFEEESHANYFTGTNGTQAATVERVAYADMGVNGDGRGDYALKLSHASDCWPHFRINFGKTLPAGTVITFDAYGNYDSTASGKYMKVQLVGSNATSSNPDQLIWTLVDTWKTCDPITLTADSDHLDLMYNVADSQHGEVRSWLLLDNFKVVEPIGTSLSFEFAHQAGYFTGTDVSDQTYRNVTIERVSYADAGVSALNDNGGTYALKLSHATNAWPIFRINFGKTLSAGTTITFDVYGCVSSESVVNGDGAVKIDLFGNSKNTAKGTINSTYTDLVRWAKNAQWTENCTIVLTADCSYLDLNFNIAELTNEGSGASYFLLDNLKVTAAS